MRFIFLIAWVLIAIEGQAQNSVYTCPPCGCQSDSKKFDEPGKCPSCSMSLVNQEDPGLGYDYENIYPADLCDETTPYIYLDVRTKSEYKGKLGHIKGAINIPIDNLEDRLGELEQYKDKPILVYCLISIRSVRASQLLSDSGFSDVTNLLGGMDMWNDMSVEEMPCKEVLRVIE